MQNLRRASQWIVQAEPFRFFRWHPRHLRLDRFENLDGALVRFNNDIELKQRYDDTRRPGSRVKYSYLKAFIFGSIYELFVLRFLRRYETVLWLPRRKRNPSIVQDLQLKLPWASDRIEWRADPFLPRRIMVFFRCILAEHKSSAMHDSSRRNVCMRHNLETKILAHRSPEKGECCNLPISNAKSELIRSCAAARGGIVSTYPVNSLHPRKSRSHFNSSGNFLKRMKIWNIFSLRLKVLQTTSLTPGMAGRVEWFHFSIPVLGCTKPNSAGNSRTLRLLSTLFAPKMGQYQITAVLSIEEKIIPYRKTDTRSRFQNGPPRLRWYRTWVKSCCGVSKSSKLT